MHSDFTHLLVALDGSGLAEVALPVAIAFARKNGGEITLLHVVEPDAPATIHGDHHLRTQSEATEYLDTLADSFRREGLAIRTAVVMAGARGVAATISDALDEHGCDLLILATHGEGGLRDLLFGRVAQQVLQLATRPLVIVPAARKLSTFDCATMLVPLDGSESGEIKLPMAASVANMFQCRIVLIRVVPTPGTLQGTGAAVGMLLPGTTAALLRYEVPEAARYLRVIAAEWFPDHNVSIEVLRGQVETELERSLIQHRADLLVMSTHGRSGLSALLEGSIGQRMVSRAVCPILLLRLPDQRNPATTSDNPKQRPLEST